MKFKLCLLLSLVGILLTAQPICASDEPYVSYTIEDDAEYSNAELISSESHMEDGRLIIVNTYKENDGTIITDTINTSAITTCSKNGSDTVTRTKEIAEWGTITIRANFDWYTENGISYVRCSGMTARYSMDPLALEKTWETSYTSEYVAFGKAKAQVKYYFYNKDIPASYRSGTYKITCTDEGTISDN